jgi:hypothetical protein
LEVSRENKTENKKKVRQAKNKGENDPQDVMGLVSDNMYDDDDPWKTSQLIRCKVKFKVRTATAFWT